jgi:hypothetical protein
MKADSTRFKLKFGGEHDDINATTYGQILVNTVVLLEETNKELKTGAHLEIKVKSEKAGSFLVDLGIEPSSIVAAVVPLMTHENIQTVKNVATHVIKTATKAYEFWKKLKGEKPKEVTEKGENVVIVTGDGNTVTIEKPVYNLTLNNKRSQEAIANSFAALSKDKSVTDFSVLSEEKEEPLFIAEQEEFPLLAKKVKGILPVKRPLIETVDLYIIRQSFDRSLKSDYLYRGIPISASITDETFWEAVNRGERYGLGDILLSELQIDQEFNKTLNTYQNACYTITRVLQHIPRGTQSSLFETD